jgi:hypothetical protein
MHARSISLGAHRAAGLPPTGPVPPLPVIAPHHKQTARVRDGFCLSRMSSSSQESASSSVLVTNPILRAPDVCSNSPSLEQIVADDDSASLKTVSHRQWQNPLVAGPRPIPDTSPTVPALATAHQHKPSVRSNIARYSADSQLSRQLSMTSVASSLESEKHNRLWDLSRTTPVSEKSPRHAEYRDARLPCPKMVLQLKGKRAVCSAKSVATQARRHDKHRMQPKHLREAVTVTHSSGIVYLCRSLRLSKVVQMLAKATEDKIAFASRLSRLRSWARRLVGQRVRALCTASKKNRWISTA